MDEVPTYGYFPPVYYYQGRVREGLKSPESVSSYRAYLDIREPSRRGSIAGRSSQTDWPLTGTRQTQIATGFSSLAYETGIALSKILTCSISSSFPLASSEA